MSNETDSEKLSLQERMQQLGSLTGFIVDFLATLLSVQEVSYWLGHKKELKKKIREVFVLDEYFDIRQEWQKFYKDFLGWDVDFSRVIIPVLPINKKFKYRLIFIANGLRLNEVFDAWDFTKHKDQYFGDLDKEISKNARNADKNYAIWVVASVTPTHKFLGGDSYKVGKIMHDCITLLEMMVFAAKYFSETGKHLEGVTDCSGSRRGNFEDDGDVPSIFTMTSVFKNALAVHYSRLNKLPSKVNILRYVVA
ncbi:MAG: hypothetical protein V4439_00570 [Patescibacteria group bacterium]